MARVRKRNEYDTFDKMLSRFKKIVDKDNIIRTYCEKEFYEKKSLVRKKARDMAVKRHKRTLRDENNKLKEMRLQSKR
jgi:ribosomal protein S21